jgi:hypothetical protein
MYFCDIDKMMPLKEPADKTRMFLTLLKGRAFSYFKHHCRRRLGAEDSDITDDELIELVLRDIELELFRQFFIFKDGWPEEASRG